MYFLQRRTFAICVAASIAGCSFNSTPPGVVPPNSGAQRAAGSERRHRTTMSSPVVYNFPKKVNDGLAFPEGPLYAAPGGTLLGTTSIFYSSSCGYCGPGAVYSVKPTTSGPPTISTIWLFDGPDGAEPETGVVRGAEGSLYGTTTTGGVNFYACASEYEGCGVLFKLTKTGSAWSETVLHYFNSEYGPPDDGIAPGGPPLLVNGTLFGITMGGGVYPYDYGTMYKESTNGTGYQIVHRFDASAEAPVGTLIMDSSGRLYGETQGGESGGSSCGGSLGCGTVYRINSDGSGYTVLYQFKGLAYGDGGDPTGYLTLVNGNLFGATDVGGQSGCGDTYADPGCGTLFELRKNSNGAYTETVIYKFSADPNGSSPLPWGMVLDSANGNLYGTTLQAGDCSGSYGGSSGSCGTIFKLNPSTGAYSTIYQFDGAPDGALPHGAPAISNGVLWGETYAGGLNKTGTIWSWSIPVINARVSYRRERRNQ